MPYTVKDANISTGFFYSMSKPRAQYFERTYRRIYFCYSDETNAAAVDLDDVNYINYYDLDTESFGTPVNLGTYSSDFHAPATLVIDRSGYIHCFYGGHQDGELYYRKSTNPEDISAFSAAVDILPAATNSTWNNAVILDNDDMLLFFRYGTAENVGFLKSTDGGANWSASITKIADLATGKMCYGFAVKSNYGNRIHFSAWQHDFAGQTVDFIFYAYSDDEGTSWKRIDDSAITLPMTAANMTVANFGRVADAINLNGGVYGLDDNAKRQPFILYRQVSGSTIYFKMGYWENGQWNLSSIYNSDLGYICDLKVFSAENIHAFIDADYSLLHYLWNGSSWSKYEDAEKGTGATDASGVPYILEKPLNSLNVIYMWGTPSGFDNNIHIGLYTPRKLRNALDGFKAVSRFQNVTRRALSLGDQDSTTGWYDKHYNESSIKMAIVSQSQATKLTGMGVYVSRDAVGITQDEVSPGDEIVDYHGNFYDVETVENTMIHDVLSHYVCQLSKKSLRS